MRTDTDFAIQTFALVPVKNGLCWTLPHFQDNWMLVLDFDIGRCDHADHGVVHISTNRIRDLRRLQQVDSR